MSSEEFDYIIVGGGTAGCVVAARLSQRLPTKKIVLIEYGPDERENTDVKTPARFLFLGETGLRVEYPSVPQPQLKDRSIINWAGRLVSGSSAVNGGHWARGTREDYHEWAKLAGHERFEFDNLLPYFKRSETHWDKNGPASRGYDGPIHDQPRGQFPLRQPLRQAMEDAGFKENLDPFGGDNSGFCSPTEGWKQLSESSAVRQHSGFAYDMSKVHIMANSRVRRIMLTSDQGKEAKAVGAELYDGKKIVAREEVILSAGAHRTPQVLMLSGIGPREALKAHNIDVVVDSPEVGKNQWDHSCLYQFWKVRDISKGQSMFSPNFPQKPEYGRCGRSDWQLRNGVEDVAGLKAVMKAEGHSDAQIDAYTDPSRNHLWRSFTYLPYAATPAYSKVKMDGNHILSSVINLLPTSRGEITLDENDVDGQHVLNPRYMTTKTDQHVLADGVRQMASLMQRPSLKAEIEGETPPDGFETITPESSNEVIIDRVASFSDIYHHCAGTASLGTVVDSEFRVKGTTGLRVVDASVFPSPLTGFPQASVYAIAELASDLVLGAV